MIAELKQILGPKCTAIKVNGELKEFVNLPSKKMRFCEAVNHSFNVPIKISNENLGCPGARRCVDFDHTDAQLSESISKNNNIPAYFTRNALNNIPKLINITHIVLGMTEYMEEELQPDLYIVYVKPVSVTVLMHNLAKFNIIPSLPPYSLLSVCGNVFSNCYKNNTVSLSFGCPESRKHGGIGENEVVLGIPNSLAFRLIQGFQG